MDLDECMNISLEKRSDGTYSFTAKTLPIYEIDSAKSSYAELQTSSERKTSQDNPKSSDDNARSSPYLNAESDQPETPLLYTRTHSQSQTDSNDFTQSFHSHTTSVTDNDLLYTGSSTYFAEQNIRDHNDEGATKNQQRTATTATKSSSKQKTSRETRRGRKSKATADETRRDDAGKRFRPHQSSRGNSFDGSSIGFRTNRFGEQLPDPVHILPETLVTVATHVGSIAYVTARHMFNKFDKLRSQTVSSQTAFK